MKYKVGDEFIVKIKEVMDSDNGTLYRSNFNTLVFDEYGLDKLQKYDEVKERLELIDELKLVERNKGMMDAWELVKKLADMPFQERADIFGYCCNGITVTDVLRDFTPQQALAKIEAYEGSNAIKVGDVVYADDEPDSFGVVTWFVDDKYAYVLWDDGSSGFQEDISDIHKTGRHIDISNLLEQIRGNE